MHRHAFKGRKLNRETGPRGLMLRNLATSVILHEKVKTTLPKAKEIRPIVERVLTKAKKNDINTRRALNTYLLDKNATEKALVELGPLYAERNGGYTRITKIGPRGGDAAEMAYIELLDVEKLVKKTKEKLVAKETKEKAKKVDTKNVKKEKSSDNKIKKSKKKD